MELIQVHRRTDLRRFIKFPKELYTGDPLWVPPLWFDEKRAYKEKHNPILANSDYTLLILREGPRILGRCIPYIDRQFNDYYGTNTGLFGAFECVDDTSAAAVLIEGMEEWLRTKKVNRIRGPINPIAEYWGFLLDGDGKPPVFMTPHTPEYYISRFETHGYKKAMDLIAYEANRDGNYEIPERTRRFLSLLARKKPGISVRRFRKQSIIEDAEHIWRLTNISLADNWGYVPVDREVMLDMVKRLKPIIDPDAIWFVEDNGTPVGYCLGFPDLNIVLRKIDGRLFPSGFLRLLSKRKKLGHYRLFGLAVHPKYHNLGLDVLLYVSLFDALKPRGIRLEANYVLETNRSIRNALEKLKLTQIKSYRIFEKELK